MFGPFKSRVQAQLHKLSRHTRCIDVFGASMCLTTAYNASVTYINILHGFKRTGLWVRNADGPSAERLTRLFTEHGRKVTVAEVMRFFDKSTRGLLFSADVVENGTMRINTSTGAVLTCDQVLGTLNLRAQRRERALAPRAVPLFSAALVFGAKLQTSTIHSNRLVTSAVMRSTALARIFGPFVGITPMCCARTYWFELFDPLPNSGNRDKNT